MSDQHHDVNYKKIYFTLVALLAISVAGPFLGIFWVTLITAFGIAVVKANLVIENFMHLRWEKRIMKWMLASSLLLMFLLVAGVSPDVMNHEGDNWENLAAKAAAKRDLSGGTHDAAAEHVAEPEAETAAAEEEAAPFDARAAFNNACATCHGQAGDGAGPAGGALNPPPANFTDATFWATRDGQRIFDVIKNGAASVGGSPLMVAWGNSFSDDEIGALRDYVMSFRPGGE
jgi:caa(3)-type oxidase subunit IV